MAGDPRGEGRWSREFIEAHLSPVIRSEVNGSARPQTICEADNPFYYRVLDLYYHRTRVPVLVNTSFNVHEEPIVDTPERALKSLTDGRIDMILTNEKVYWRHALRP